MSESPGLERETRIDNSGSAGGVPPKKNPDGERQAMVLAFIIIIATSSTGITVTGLAADDRARHRRQQHRATDRRGARGAGGESMDRNNRPVLK
jgi:hypothetical protein